MCIKRQIRSINNYSQNWDDVLICFVPSTNFSLIIKYKQCERWLRGRVNDCKVLNRLHIVWTKFHLNFLFVEAKLFALYVNCWKQMWFRDIYTSCKIHFYTYCWNVFTMHWLTDMYKNHFVINFSPSQVPIPIILSVQNYSLSWNSLSITAQPLTVRNWLGFTIKLKSTTS